MRNDLLTSSSAPVVEAGSGIGDDGPIAILMRGVRVPLEMLLRRLADELKAMDEKKLARLGRKLQTRFRTSFPALKGVLGVGKPQGDLSPQQTMGLVLITAVSELLGQPKVIDAEAQPALEALLRECLGGLDESARAALTGAPIAEATLDIDRLVKSARLVGYKLIPAQVEAAFAANPDPDAVAQALAGDRIAPEGVHRLAGVVAACLVESKSRDVPPLATPCKSCGDRHRSGCEDCNAGCDRCGMNDREKGSKFCKGCRVDESRAPLRGALLAEGQYDQHVKAIWDAINATEDDGTDVEDVINDTVIAYAEQNGLDPDDLGDAVVAFGTAEGYIEAIEEAAAPNLRAGLLGEGDSGGPLSDHDQAWLMKAIKVADRLGFSYERRVHGDAFITFVGDNEPLVDAFIMALQSEPGSEVREPGVAARLRKALARLKD